MTNETFDARGRPRVVITGVGMLSPLGHSVDESWDNLLAGRSGVGPITQFDASEFPCRVAGEVKDFVARDYMDFKEARRMSRASQLTVAASRMALADAALPERATDPDRTGVLIGTAVGGIERAFEEIAVFQEKGLRSVSPFAMTMFLANMPSHHVSLMTGSTGPIGTTVAACATGTQTIGEAAEQIRRGAADMMFAGGVEGLIHFTAIAGFSAMRALTTHFNDTPERASRPFDKDRDGFVLAEGAGVMVLERLDHALARGARIHGEVLGHASSSDAYHVAAPDPEARGAIRAMAWALQDAGLDATQIDYINAHGTSTPLNDAIETLAIKRLFGERAYEVAISSTKSAMGHAMGGTGTIESIFTTLALSRGIIPPTWNYETPDPECDLDYVPNAPRPANIRFALKNSFGLGGQNACLVLARYNGHPPASDHSTIENNTLNFD
jgi:beta-ketoacyl-acyl-carrier-protein synthase II